MNTLPEPDIRRERAADAPGPALPVRPGERRRWGCLPGDALALALAEALHPDRLLLVVAPDMPSVERLGEQVPFFAGERLPVLRFPDWETLPYDRFSPHQDIVSDRLETLARLPGLRGGILLLPVATLMQRLSPPEFLQAHTLVLEVGERIDVEAFRARLDQAGYRAVHQVMEHGEYAVRGALIDLYPAGAARPYRLDLFDDEIESIRRFDPETQRSIDRVEAVRLLPAREFPVDAAGIRQFRRAWRAAFEGDPSRSPLYEDVSRGLLPGGIEYYLPLFFERTVTLFDYLPGHTTALLLPGWEAAAADFTASVQERFEQLRHDRERPLLPPERLFLDDAALRTRLEALPQVEIRRHELPGCTPPACVNLPYAALPDLTLKPRQEEPAAQLKAFLQAFPGPVLFTAESAGRREALHDMLHDLGIAPERVDGWHAFVSGMPRAVMTALAVAPLEQGFQERGGRFALITEQQLLGRRARQARRRRSSRDPEALIRDLTDLQPGAPVVHEEHGVGRFLGLQRLQVGGQEGEFLTLEYAGGDRLYVPVASLHLISRYTGAAPENAPLHRLGTDQWEKARRRAAKKARDVAAELLDIHARRAARRGHRFQVHYEEYRQFAASFPFEETPDQQKAIEEVLADMASPRPMDRLVCGDVGFGKTEVALRAAFVAAADGRQVAVLVPTTLLAQQHYQNFRDRLADWPFRVEMLSRFRSPKQQKAVLADLAAGRVDIVIGTHKLLQPDVRFKQLGLVIIDEEQRFGVRHKEKLKALRAEVDVLTLTATPIPRTLNMALSGLRDLSIIATPPEHRLAVKTFLIEWNDQIIREACLREIKRGGQIYFVHNEVETIEKVARTLAALVPEARIGIGHGRMRERDLEQVMLDFYHRRFNILVCTTIIESGIDIPTANTMLIHRADRFGLAQLHQLRGRVGRSHHRAYCYLITPPPRAMTPEAVKRLEAIESLEELGAGFSLATHDLEIRGAGELLGEEQSGQIGEVGFALYTELLERAVQALRAGREPVLDQPLHHGTEVDLHETVLIPDDYLPDVHARLVLYKRIASAPDAEALRELQVEMIDRFGLLPEPVKRLFAVTELKLLAERLGIRRIDAGERSGRLVFDAQPNIDAAALVALLQEAPETYRFDGREKLRFEADMATFEARLAQVRTLLERIAPR
ncbi:MAG: transcription-repair coupling factor [Gammaproteobacteria bacterium]|nr:MAG: transcription-repair coupling factor [Gammaproteobacteria bacterium]